MAEKTIKINNLAEQAGLLIAALLCLTAVFFAVKWCAANAIAAHTIDPETADFALSLAPGDPQTHYTIAVLSERDFSSENLPKSIGEYERATALAPDDYRTWLALGKARERGGDAAGAESAARRARALAPNYSEANWVLGNILLRQNKRQEAFAEMRRAAETDSNYVNSTVGTAWQIYDGDLTQIRQSLGESAAVNSALVAFLTREKRFDAAVGVWNSLAVDDKKTIFKENGKFLFDQLIAAGKYRDAARIMAETENSPVGKLFNGAFETDVKPAGAAVFDWQILGGAQPQIGVDDQQKHGGNRSLVLIFNSPTGREFRVFAQIVAVEAGGKYAFEVFYKSELKSAATLYWEIAEIGTGKILAQTPPAAAVSNHWTNQKIEFVAAPNTEAVTVRLAREPCKSTLCPISGRVWFDDLSLSEIQN